MLQTYLQQIGYSSLSRIFVQMTQVAIGIICGGTSTASKLLRVSPTWTLRRFSDAMWFSEGIGFSLFETLKSILYIISGYGWRIGSKIKGRLGIL